MALSNPELAQLIENYWTQLNQDRAYWRDFIAGTVTGGPNGDGTYPVPDYTGNINMLKCPARIAFEATRISVATLDASGTPPTLTGDHFNKKLRITGGTATTPVTIIAPRTAPIGASIVLRGLSASVKVIAESGAPGVQNADGHNGSAGPGKTITLSCEDNPGGNSALWYIDGSTGIVA